VLKFVLNCESSDQKCVQSASGNPLFLYRETTDIVNNLVFFFPKCNGFSYIHMFCSFPHRQISSLKLPHLYIHDLWIDSFLTIFVETRRLKYHTIYSSSFCTARIALSPLLTWHFVVTWTILASSSFGSQKFIFTYSHTICNTNHFIALRILYCSSVGAIVAVSLGHQSAAGRPSPLLNWRTALFY
jgi:hypothetical protein